MTLRLPFIDYLRTRLDAVETRPFRVDGILEASSQKQEINLYNQPLADLSLPTRDRV